MFNSIIAFFYFGQLKKLNNSPTGKIEVINSDNKLQELGFVDFVENLIVEQQNKISSSVIYIFYHDVDINLSSGRYCKYTLHNQ